MEIQGKNNENDIVNRVKEKLFNVSIYDEKKVLHEAVKVIYKSLGCVECSLWTINHNSTRDDADKKDFVSTSVIHRFDKINFIFSQPGSFVHELKDSLFEDVVRRPTELKNYYRYLKTDKCFSQHTTPDFVKQANIQELVIIPIRDKKNSSTVVALFASSYSEQTIESNYWEPLSKIIQTFFESAFKNDINTNKRRLMEALINAHGNLRNEKVDVLFDKIKTIIGLFCPSQGASFFMWDNHKNIYRLVATTGLEPSERDEEQELFYYKGEGITGWMGTHPKPFISDDILNETAGDHNKQNGKLRENMKDPATRAMYIPIISPTNKNNVIGVFRFVNKKNVRNNDVIDYFNDIDVDWMSYAAEYLALVVDRYQKEEEQTAFISKLAHEFKTPANAIYKSATRLQEHINDPLFLERYLYSYLDNIVDFTQLQIWQANTTLYLAKNYKVKYNNRRCSLYDVLKKSRDVVRPIAREYGLKFRNIVINPMDSNLCLNIDEEAFVIVFHNLLTNAIKYHNPQKPDGFYVSISCFSIGGTIKVIVQDSGIGIDNKEKEMIFQVGYRGTNAFRENASGFGVGLPVVKQIVEDYGGNINVESCKNPTIFIITLPNSLIKYE